MKREAIRRLKGESSTPFEFQFITKSGKTRWGIETIAPTQFEGKKATLGYFMDITAHKQAEEELRQRGQEYRSLVNNIPGFVFKGYTDYTVEFFDDKIETFTGYAKEEFNSKRLNWSELIIQEDLQNAKAIFVQALNLDRQYVREYRIKKKGGEIVWIQERSQILRDQEGDIDYITGIFFDITERKQAETAWRESEEKYRNLVETTGTGYLILNSQGKVIDANKEYVRLSGHISLEEILGKRVVEWTAEYDRQRNSAEIIKCLQQGYVRGLEIDYVDAQGRITPIEINATVISTGESFQIVSLCRDITARKQAEEALREMGDYLRKLIRYANAPIIIWNPESRITQFNKAFENLTGYRSEEVIGQNLDLLFPDTTRTESINQIESTLRGEYWESVEIPILRKDGKIRIALWNSANIYGPDAKTLVATMAQGQDITERKQAEQTLQLSHRFLEIANRHSEMAPLLQEFVKEVQKTMQCQAVAIRVLDAEANIPYQAYEGFSPEFYERESPLSIKRDECMCINVIKGTTDPQLPFYTPGGSFYMNATTRFLATVSEEEKGRTPNACTEFGYESVALVPIRLGDHILGLIHVADPQENMVPLQRVEQLEGIAHQLGAAMQRVSSKVALEKIHRQYELILTSAWEGILGLDPNGNHTFVNPAAAKMLGYEVEELIGRQSHSTWHHTRPNGSPYPAEECPIYKAFRKGIPQHMTGEQFIRKDGTSFLVEAISTPIKENGDISGTVVTFWDITRRRKGEKALKDSMEKMQRILDGTVKALASAVETRDPYTAGHQIRVATLASAIAGEMGLSVDQIEGIKIAAILHDIGKIGVPAEILSKPGRLSDTEFSLIKGHPQAGCEIFAGIDFPFPVPQIVAQHHERLDGSGYPCGLEGDDIILGARILAVADVVEAMASHRPYRPALGIDQALDEITKNKGTLYDAEVVEACIRLFTEKEFRFEA